MNFMRKKFVCIFLSVILFCSCSSKITNNKVMTLTSGFIASNQLNVDNENFVKMNHIQSMELDLKQCKINEIDTLNNRKFITCKMLRDNLILETYSESNRNNIEIGLLDTKSNEYRKIGCTYFSAAYGDHSILLQDRFYATNLSYENNGEIHSKILLYDSLKDKLIEADTFKTLNIVQYITPVKDNGFAYCYYEHYTQDLVVKYYDLSSNTSKEIFRYSYYTESNISPMSLSFNMGNITLVMQSIKDNKYHTQIAYINIENGLEYVEEVNFSEYFGTEYEILDFIIQDQVYFLKVGISDSIEWHIFKRNNDKIKIILPTIFHLNELIFNYSNEISGSIFRQYNSPHADLINLNTFDSSIKTYYIKGIELNEIDCIRSNGKDIIFILNSDNKFQYVCANNYNEITKTKRDQALFVYPQDEYDNIIPEKAKEMQTNIENRLHSLCESDFRWKYLFENNLNR